jgi:large subunit ribosomal protein L25
VVAYGREQATLNLSVSSDQLRDILLSERGRNSVIDLQVEGDGNHSVMIKEFTLHPISRKLVHADFVRIDENAPIEVRVPFRATGKSKGEVAGGTVLVNVREVKVLCAPNAIPIVIEADVSHLEIDDEIKIKDLVLPEGTELNESPERKLLIVVPPRVAEEDNAEDDDSEAAEGEASGDDAAPKSEAGSTDGAS